MDDTQKNGRAPSEGTAVSTYSSSDYATPLRTAALDYVRRGWALTWMPHGSKFPPHKAWNTAANVVTDAAGVPKRWNGTPRNIGLVHALGAVKTCSLDVDKVSHTRATFAEFGIDLDEIRQGVPCVVGNPENFRLLFVQPPGLDLPLVQLEWPDPTDPKKKITVFELRAGANQDVLPPSLHPLGIEYQWAHPLPSDPSEHPTPPAVLLNMWQHWAEWEPQLKAACPWARPATPSSAPTRTESTSLSVIDAFNAVHDVRGILEQHGYQRRGEHRYLPPNSTSGVASVRILDTGMVYSSNGSCPLNDGHGHDAFDCWRILEHGGEVRTAVREAARLLGMDAVATAIPAIPATQPHGDAATVARIATVAVANPDNWPDPQPLSAKFDPEPYPLDALPEGIRAAVEEVAGFVKAPIPLVASSALAALSLACQAHIDAKRAERLHGPVGLFMLTIADSGERKSTCDGFFTRAIRDYEEAQAEAAKPALKDHKAAIEAWEAKRGGVKEKIRQLAKDNKPTAGMESALRDLEHNKPEPPRIPRLLYADATPEALAYGLAKQWPSGGVVSAEAGVVFGSHGMGKDSVMRNLGLLNQLWDGASLTIDRRTSESFTVRGARLTVALQVQEPTLREFFKQSGALARGTGFLARFLVAWPESTQGQRPFTEAPANWPHLAAFHRRIAAILDQPAPIDEDGVLTPAMLSLAPAAKAAWIEYHDAIESELSSGGELYDVRDVASKSADNAARLAALFQMFDGAGGAIGIDAFEGASRITAWHLSEARRFFAELALPAELADAAQLDAWLIGYCQRERVHFVGKNHVRQHGPLRDGGRLDAAIRELAELDRLRLEKDGKRLTIRLNPAIVGAA